MSRVLSFTSSISVLCSQVCELNVELYSVQEERDNLVSAQAVSDQDNERLKGETVKAQEQRESMQKLLADAELKEVQLSQQLTETTEELLKVQTDLQRLSEDNRSLRSSLEEDKHMVGTRLGLLPSAPFLIYNPTHLTS